MRFEGVHRGGPVRAAGIGSARRSADGARWPGRLGDAGRMAAVGRTEPQLHRREQRPGRDMARSGPPRYLEPAARHRALGDRRGRRPALHDVSVGNGRAAAGPVGAPKKSVIALDATIGRDHLGAQVSVPRAKTSASARAALDTAHRRRSSLHHRHQPTALRLRQAHGQSAVVARFHQGVQFARAADSAGREDRLRLQPDCVRDTIICSVGGPGQSVMAFRQSDGAVVWKSGDFLTSDAPPILIDFDGTPAARLPRGRHRHGARSGHRRGAVVASARSGQRSQLQHADLGQRQHPVRLVGLQGRQPCDSVEEAGRCHACRGAVVHQPRALHVSQRGPYRRFRLRHDRRFRPGVSDGAQHQDRAVGVAASRVRARRASSMPTARRSSWTKTATSRWRSWRRRA